MPSIADRSLAELVSAMKSRELSVEECVKYYLHRIEKYKYLNAVSQIAPDVIAMARELDTSESRDKPLFGAPILVKDNIDVKGLVTSAGSVTLSDNIACDDAPIIANLRKNGAIILGKTNMTEFANYVSDDMPNGYSSLGGQVLNAYGVNVDPGGSSTGSAVAVSAGLCAAAIGTDTSFSIVGCATDNGVAGLKPARGSLSGKGIVPISATLDTAGVLGKNMEDAIAVYSAMRKESLDAVKPRDITKMNIVVNIAKRNIVSDAQRARYNRLIGALKDGGASVRTVNHPEPRGMGAIMTCEFRRDIEAYLAGTNARNNTLSKIVAAYMENPVCVKYAPNELVSALNSDGVNSAAYSDAMSELIRLREYMLEDLSDADACIMTGVTEIMHFVGFPCVAVKMCMADDDTPRGAIMYAADERKLLEAALTIEKYCLPVVPPKLRN